MVDLVPSPAFPTALAALEELIPGATSLSAAVAFVTAGGVARLRELVAGQPDLELQIVARAAPVTEPEALLSLRDDLGADVSVVMGQHAPAFHPKLWLLRNDERVSVLAGSGNLTEGGIVRNDEQFEIYHLEAGSDAAEGHEERFERLTTHAVPLDQAQATTVWHEWLAQIKQRREHERALKTLDDRLASRTVVVNRDADKLRLCDDLDDLYVRTVDARLPRKDGQPYIPHRFRQGIDRGRRSGNPVPVVARICRRQTEGFDVILAAKRRDLTVEALVVDEAKSYHDLFSTETKRLSAERLKQFD